MFYVMDLDSVAHDAFVSTPPIPSPISVPEIRQKLYSYFGKNDLLRCRLVCKTWNLEASHLLTTGIHCIRLDNNNIEGHVKFLNLNPDCTLSLKYHVSLQDCDFEEVRSTLSRIDKLVRLRGPTCIAKLNCEVPRNLPAARWRQLYSTIENIGAGLTDLSIHETCEFMKTCTGEEETPSNCDWDQIFNTINKAALGLQKLSVLEHGFPVSHANLQPEPETGLFNFAALKVLDSDLPSTKTLKLIQSAPNLRSLSLVALETKHPNIIKRRQQQQHIHELLDACHDKGISLEHLEELELVIGRSSRSRFLRALHRFQFPKIKTLLLQLIAPMQRTDASLLNAFLSNNCLSLRSLKILFSSEYGFHYHEFSQTMPNLPNLTHFGYRTCLEPHLTSRISSDGFMLSNYAGIMDKLPSLETFSIDLGICLFTNKDNDKMIRDWDIKFMGLRGFPTVSALTLTVKHVEYGSVDIIRAQPTMTQNMEQLQTLFPNVKKLVFTNQVQPNVSKSYQKLVLRSMLETIGGLEVLELRNYNEDWLSQVMCESTAAVQNLKSIRTIRIPEIEKELIEQDEEAFLGSSLTGVVAKRENDALGLSSNRPIVCLATFLTYLPCLELLQVASASGSAPWTENLMEVELLLKSRSNVQLQYI